MMTSTDLAYEAYITQVKANPELVDRFGNYDYALADELEKAFAQFYPDEVVERVVNRYKNREPDGEGGWRQREPEYPGEQDLMDLRAAQELTSEYWSVPDKLLGKRPELLDLWNDYQALPGAAEREGFKLRFGVIDVIEKQITLRRERMRLLDPDLDFALMRYWDYRALHPQMQEFERLQVRQGLVGALTR